MKKYLIYTDVHWSTYSSIVRRRGTRYSVRLENLIKSMNWVENLAISQNCDGEICLGDFFNSPVLEAEELTALQDVQWNHLPKKFIVGNHESAVNSLVYSSTKSLEALNAEIIDKPLTEQINEKVSFYFMPYVYTDKALPLKSLVNIDQSKKAVVFAHADLAGMEYGKFISTTGISVESILAGCNLFLNGHLHNESVIDNRIIMVGNLTGQNFNENAAIYDHLAYVLTVEDDGGLKLESFSNPYSMNFYKIRIDNDQDLEQLRTVKDNAVVSVTCSDNMLEQVNRTLKSSKKIIESRVIVVYAQTKPAQEAGLFADTDHMRQFIEFAQQKLEPSSALTEELARLGGV